jgi:type I restriction enzyme S subunit
VSRIDDLIAEHCPDGVEYRPLGEVGEFIRGQGIQKKDLRSDGMGAIHYGQVFTTYGTTTSETVSFVDAMLGAQSRRARPGDLIVATTSENDEDVCKAVAWIGVNEIAVSSDAVIYRHTLDPGYVSYYFQSTPFQTQKRPFITGTKVRRVSPADLGRILIPVPPMEVQREIARVVERLAGLEAALEAVLRAELDARGQQYVHYRSGLLTFADDVPRVALSEVCTAVSSGGTPPTGRRDFYGGDIPWLRTQEVDFNVIESTGVRITEAGLRASAAKWVPANSVIVAMYGATAAKVAINVIPLTTNQACCNLQIDPARANFRYVFHWLCSQYEALKSLGEGSQSNLNAAKVKAFPIPLPSLAQQDRIVELLDSYDSLVARLSSELPAEIAARLRQYEFYRDRLLSFPERVA